MKKKKILLLFLIILAIVFFYSISKERLPQENDRHILGYPKDFNRGASAPTIEHLWDPNYYFEFNGFVYYHQPSSVSVSGHSSKTRDVKLKNSDPATFQMVDSNFAKDKNQVYYWGSIVEKADPKTFEPLDWPRAKDKNYYFNQTEITEKIE